MKHAAYQTQVGEGLRNQAQDHPEFGDAQVVEVPTMVGSKKITYYWVKSENFPTKYYILSHQNGSWYFTGEKSISHRYISKVEEYLAGKEAKKLEEVAA